MPASTWGTTSNLSYPTLTPRSACTSGNWMAFWIAPISDRILAPLRFRVSQQNRPEGDGREPERNFPIADARLAQFQPARHHAPDWLEREARRALPFPPGTRGKRWGRRG